MERHIFFARQGQMMRNQIYFYTATIHQFKELLYNDDLKKIVINSLTYLVNNKLAIIYGYVIMPNHLHLLWHVNDNDRKESVAGSFSKYTAHEFKKYLKINNVAMLNNCRSEKSDRRFQFWERDPLAIPISNENILIEKLNYIHNNPVKEKWALSKYPEDYKYSSAKFYQCGSDEFNFVKHFRD
jgi:putative transposase